MLPMCTKSNKRQRPWRNWQWRGCDFNCPRTWLFKLQKGHRRFATFRCDRLSQKQKQMEGKNHRFWILLLLPKPSFHFVFPFCFECLLLVTSWDWDQTLDSLHWFCYIGTCKQSKTPAQTATAMPITNRRIGPGLEPSVCSWPARRKTNHDGFAISLILYIWCYRTVHLVTTLWSCWTWRTPLRWMMPTGSPSKRRSKRNKWFCDG